LYQAERVFRVVHELNGNVLIYDNYGISGTSLLSSLAQIFCDPFYRTFEGFKILVHKDWVFYKHNFTKKNLMLRDYNLVRGGQEGKPTEAPGNLTAAEL
jgi:hypothetical protein